MDRGNWLVCTICNNIAFATQDGLDNHILQYHVEEENLDEDLVNWVLSNDANLDLEGLNVLVDDASTNNNNNNNNNAEDSSSPMEEIVENVGGEHKEQQVEDEIRIVGEISNRRAVQQTVNNNNDEDSNGRVSNCVEGDRLLSNDNNNVVSSTSEENKESGSEQEPNQPAEVEDDEITIIRIVNREKGLCLTCNRKYESEDNLAIHQKSHHFRFIFPKMEEDNSEDNSNTPTSEISSNASFGHENSENTEYTTVEDNDVVLILSDDSSDEDNENEAKNEKTVGRLFDIDCDPNAIFSEPGESSEEDDDDDDKLYECHFCSKMFFWKCSLKKHVQNCSRAESTEKIHHENISEEQPDEIISKNQTPEVILISPNISPNSSTSFSSSNSSTSSSPSTSMSLTLNNSTVVIAANIKQRKTKSRPKSILECKYCGKKLGSLVNLGVHERTHTGQKPFHCNYPGCSFSCSARSNLNAHEGRHYRVKTANSRRGPRIYKCQFCRSRFKSKENFELHQRTHN